VVCGEPKRTHHTHGYGYREGGRTVEYHELLHKESAEKFFTGSMKDAFPIEFVNNFVKFMEEKSMTDGSVVHSWANEEDLAMGEYSIEVKFSLRKKCNRKLSTVQKIKRFLKL